MSTDTFYELKGIRKSFSEREILKGVDLSVNKGDVITILGASGSGKTTLLRIADFLETPDAGNLSFDGKTYDLAHLHATEARALRRKTGFVFQNYNLFRNKTALENVTEGLIYAFGKTKAEAREIGLACLNKVGLADRAESYPSQLSGGQQQRVGIARAIASEPEIIFMDEPTSALDPELVGEVKRVIEKLANDGRTMVIVTHDLGFARHAANRVIFMDQGVIVEENNPQDFFTSPKHVRTQRFIQLLDGGSTDYMI